MKQKKGRQGDFHMKRWLILDFLDTMEKGGRNCFLRELLTIYLSRGDLLKGNFRR